MVVVIEEACARESHDTTYKHIYTYIYICILIHIYIYIYNDMMGKPFVEITRCGIVSISSHKIPRVPIRSQIHVLLCSELVVGGSFPLVLTSPKREAPTHHLQMAAGQKYVPKMEPW